MIELRNLTKHYIRHQQRLLVLNAIDLSIKTGVIQGIVGKSGAGKSTLIRCINLLERPDEGAVVVNGQDLMQLSAKQLRLARQQIGMIFQSFNLLQTRTVYDNIALPLQLAGHHRMHESIQAKIQVLLELTGMIHRQHAYPHQLSGGEKQRVAIARALVTEPKVLLADEPTSALDPETTRDILNLLQDINQRLGITIVIISHATEVIKAICDQICIMHQGEMIEAGSVMQIFKKPQHAITQKLVRSEMACHIPSCLQVTTEAIANSRPLWRIWFNGHASQEPLIAQMLQRFPIQVNIHQAHIDHLQHESIGLMLVSVIGDASAIAACQAFLESHGNQVEIIGYVTA